MKTVGVLGAGGSIGKAVVDVMLRISDANLLLGFKTDNAIPVPEGCNTVLLDIVDINDISALNSFCKKADIIINCIGPTKLTGSKIAASCLANGANYIDVSGNRESEVFCRLNDYEIKQKRLCFLSSAGIYPGVSEIFPIFFAESNYRLINELKVYFVTQGSISNSAAVDFVDRINGYSDSGMTFYEDGKIKRAAGAGVQTIPYPVGRINCYPIIDLEQKKMFARLNVHKGLFYNTYLNDNIMNTFIKIRAAGKLLDSEQTRQAAADLMEAYRNARKRANDFVLVYAEGEGTGFDGQKKQNTSKMFYKGNGSQLSGMLASYLAIVMLRGKKDSGSFFASEFVNAGDFIKWLKEQDDKLEIS